MLTHMLPVDTTSWFPWLLDLLLKSVVLLSLAGIAVLAGRRASAAQRHLIWTLAMAGVLLLPLLSAILPAWHVVRLPAWHSASTHRQAQSYIPAPSHAGYASTPDTQQPSSLPLTANVETPPVSSTGAGEASSIAPKAPTTPAPPMRASAPPAWPTWPWHAWATLVWAFGSILVLSLWALGSIFTRRILTRAMPAPETWNAAMPAGVRLMISPAIAMPVVVGIRRPTILLPAQAKEWPEERRRVVLLHELAHTQRRDLLVHLLAQLACACYWMNPLVWAAAHRMRIEREMACDDAVLAADVKPSEYATHLLAIAGALPGRRFAPVAGIAMACSSKVGRRIKGVLDGTRNRRRMTWYGMALTMLVSVILLVALAMVTESEVRQPGIATLTTPTSARIPLPPTVKIIVVSPSGNHVAYIEAEKGKQAVVIDGKPGEPYEKIRSPWFDRKPIIGDDRPNYPGLIFSPDGARLAYAVIQYTGPNGEDWFAGRQMIVVDGIKGNVYDEVSLPVFNHDSRHVAYVAKKAAGWVVVLDGKELGTYEDIGGSVATKTAVRVVSFNPLDNAIAYVVRNNGRWHVVAGDQIGPGYDDVANITYSPLGQHLVYMATINTTMMGVNTEDSRQHPASRFVPVIDGKERWDLQGATMINYSPDDRRLAAVVDRAGKQMLLVDDQPMLSAVLVCRYRFSPDSRHVACVVNNGTGNDSQILVDGKALPYTSLGWLPIYSQDSTRMADISGVNWKQAVVVNGKPLPEIEGWIDNLTLSPDGKHVVYQVSRRNGGKSFDIVVDGIVRDSQQRILGNQETAFFFGAPDRFHYFAVKDGAIERVEVRISEKQNAKSKTSQLSGSHQPVAGAPYHGLVVSLECQNTYHAGQLVLIKVREKNVGKQDVRFALYRFPYYYHLDLVNAQGELVEKTTETITAEDEEVHPGVIGRPESIVILKPGEEYVRSYDLRRYFKDLSPGMYNMQIRHTARGIFQGRTVALPPGVGALSLPCRFSIDK